MIDLIKNLLSPSVDSITASLNKAVKRLDKLSHAKATEAVSLRASAAVFTSEAMKAEFEVGRAQRTAARISRLLA